MSKTLQKVKKVTQPVLTIQAQNEETKQAVKEFFLAYKANFTPLLDAIFKQKGLSADASIKVQGDTIVVEQYAEDKGKVIASVNGETVVSDYTSLTEGDKYLSLDPSGMAVFVFVKDNADIKLGHFKGLNDALTNIDSKEVNETLERALAPQEATVVEGEEG